MNPIRPLFGRITINKTKTDLGHAPLNQLMLRAAQTFQATRSTGEVNIIIEVSGAKLPDSSLLSREQQLEQSLAEHTITDDNEDSPFEGISIGRVKEVMSSRLYDQYAYYCIASNREGVPADVVQTTKLAYELHYPDCAPHFPMWMES